MNRLLSALLIFLMALASTQQAEAFFGLGKKDDLPSITKRTEQKLDISPLHYKYVPDGIAKENSNNQQFVVCSDCPKSNLERELEEPLLAVFFSEDPETTNKRAMPPNVTITPINPTEVNQPVQTAAVERAPEASPPVENTMKEIKEVKEPLPSVCFDPIYFDYDKHEIRAAEGEKIKNGVSCLKAAKEVIVKGFTCDLGTKQYNDILARKRAAAVSEELEKYDIHASKVESEGKCCYVSDIKPMNRRVEITVIK